MANNKSKISPVKRAAQNLRTFKNVQARREKHVAAHRGMTMDDIKARTWTKPPSAK